MIPGAGLRRPSSRETAKAGLAPLEAGQARMDSTTADHWSSVMFSKSAPKG